MLPVSLSTAPYLLSKRGLPCLPLQRRINFFEKTLGNIKEVKARGASVIALVTDKHASVSDFADEVIRVPSTDGNFLPSLNVIPLQIFAYYMAVLRGCDVDKPRNLAKSVTVE